jgi:hypothetical protein
MWSSMKIPCPQKQQKGKSVSLTQNCGRNQVVLKDDERRRKKQV